MQTRFLGALIALSSLAFGQAPSQPPLAAKHPETKTVQGTKLVDDYRWLEDGAKPEVKAWVTSENGFSRSYLDGIAARKPIYEWLEQLDHQIGTDYAGVQYQGGMIFAMKYDPKMQQPALVTMKSPTDAASEQVVVDPNKLNAKGTTSIQFYVPSLDGKYVAVCMPEGGSENGGVTVFETATGKQLSDDVPRVQFATGGGSVTWKGDGSGFYYTRYPHEGERPAADANFYQQVYFHKLGTAARSDTYALGKEFPRIAETTLQTSLDGQWIMATVELGDGGQYEHFLLGPDGKWQQITHFEDGITAIGFGADGALYIDDTKNALNGKLERLALDPGKAIGVADAKVIVPESQAAIENFGFTLSGQFPAFVATKTRLYVVDTVGGPQQVRIFDLAGKELGKVPLDPVSSVDRMVALGGDEILIYTQTYLKGGGFYRFDPAHNQLEETRLRLQNQVDFSDVEVVRGTATSKDGTKVPFTVLRKKGTKLDGNNPTILTGYGGFGLSMTPGWNPTLKLWLDHGGVYVVSNLRAGAEFGESWHRAGMLLNKQHVFDDFIACAEELISEHYTSADQLGIEGGSNGGLLMGAVMTQRPELFRAVNSSVGIYDMTILESSANGQFNTTEYGSIQNAAQFKAMLAYSPYQHVVDGKHYPVALFMTGDNDARVDPAHSRKFVARLQQTGATAYLRTSANAGHGGIGAAESERLAWASDSWAFFFDQLGVKW